jgi:hypothetical protein
VELAEVYPRLAEQLADIAARIEASDAVLARVNKKLPDGSRASSAPSSLRVGCTGITTVSRTYLAAPPSCACRLSTTPEIRMRGRGRECSS